MKVQCEDLYSHGYQIYLKLFELEKRNDSHNNNLLPEETNIPSEFKPFRRAISFTEIGNYKVQKRAQNHKSTYHLQ